MVKVKSYKDYISEIFQSDLTWKQLCDCNVLVTGATGLIGHCLVEVLLLNNNINCQVFVLGRSLKRLEDKYFNYRDNERLHFVESDIGKDLNCDITFKYIIHAASPASPNFFSNNPMFIFLLYYI